MINLTAHNAVALIQKTNNKIDKIKTKLDKENIYDAQGAILHSKV